jgi:hypothetical protein
MVSNDLRFLVSGRTRCLLACLLSILKKKKKRARRQDGPPNLYPFVSHLDQLWRHYRLTEIPSSFDPRQIKKMPAGTYSITLAPSPSPHRNRTAIAVKFALQGTRTEERHLRIRGGALPVGGFRPRRSVPYAGGGLAHREKCAKTVCECDCDCDCAARASERANPFSSPKRLPFALSSLRSRGGIG